MILRRIICSLGSILFALKKRKLADLSKVKKIAVLKSGAIGDILMATPFLRALRKGFPDAVIDFHLGRWSAGTLQNNQNLNNVFTYEDSAFHSFKNISGKIRLVKSIRAQKYDLLFILDKSYLANLLGFAIGIKLRIGFDRYGEGFPNNVNIKYGPLRHEIEYYLDLARIIGIKETNTNLELAVSKTDVSFVNTLIRGLFNFVGIIPGGAKNPGGGVVESRKWPAEKFIELIHELSSTYTILLLGGKTDFEFNEEIIKKLGKRNIINFAGKTTIAQSCEIMRRCRFIICNDSGPMHIAAASGTKVISLFGPTNPTRKAPLTNESFALWKDGNIYDSKIEIYGNNPRKKYFGQLEVANVLNALKK